jgi:hypothetical protein
MIPRSAKRALALAVLMSWPGVGAAQAPGGDPGSPTPRWLAGCWEMRVGELIIEEQWMALRGGSMLGMSRVLRSGELAGHELIVLRAVGSGWVYEAHPSGQPAASFTSTAITDTSLVFSNPEHDFPQTITYSRVGADSLVARTAGGGGERPREYVFRYRRVVCPGSG